MLLPGVNFCAASKHSHGGGKMCTCGLRNEDEVWYNGDTLLVDVWRRRFVKGVFLWFLILTHAIVDFSGLFDSTFVKSNISDAEQINSISSYAPLFLLPVSLLFTAFLLRKKKLPEIIERMN